MCIRDRYSTDKGISSFVRGFGKYIDVGEDNKLYINNDGKNLIDESKCWVQILDENNYEVCTYNKPPEIKDKHTPIDIINGYKYAGGLGDTSQILAGYKEIDNVVYTYLIGYPSNIIKKYIFVTEADITNRYIKYGICLLYTSRCV